MRLSEVAVRLARGGDVQCIIQLYGYSEGKKSLACICKPFKEPIWKQFPA
jgi:hypothetical protein